jgi:hypothetical protein
VNPENSPHAALFIRIITVVVKNDIASPNPKLCCEDLDMDTSESITNVKPHEKI